MLTVAAIIGSLLFASPAQAATIPKCRHGTVLIWYKDNKTFGCSRFTQRPYGYRYSNGPWARAKSRVPVSIIHR